MPKENYSQAILGVYECNDITLLKDVFIWAYERSASRYAAVRQQIGDPDPFRLRLGAQLQEVIGAVIRASMTRSAAYAHVATWAASNMPATDVAAFREMAETELLALHNGNFARYRVRPSESAAWQKVWHPA